MSRVPRDYIPGRKCQIPRSGFPKHMTLAHTNQAKYQHVTLISLGGMGGGVGPVQKAIGHNSTFSVKIIIEVELFSTSAMIGKYFLFVFSKDRI